MTANLNSCADWSEQDLLELGQLYSVGFPIGHIAKFLGRDLEEVKEQAKALRITRNPVRQLRTA
jgi:hypothetical protein